MFQKVKCINYFCIVPKRDGVTAEHGREVKTGKLKSASSKRDVPLNDTAVAMIQDLRAER